VGNSPVVGREDECGPRASTWPVARVRSLVPSRRLSSRSSVPACPRSPAPGRLTLIYLRLKGDYEQKLRELLEQKQELLQRWEGFLAQQELRQPLADMALVAVELLASRLDDSLRKAQHLIYPPRLIVRSTTGPIICEVGGET
jgi:hypothetical protein